jgi:hypothetical protein
MTNDQDLRVGVERPYTLIFDGIAIAKARAVRAWTEPDRGACYMLQDVEPLGVLGRGFWLALRDMAKGQSHVCGRVRIQDPKNADQDVTLLPGACVGIVDRWIPIDTLAGEDYHRSDERCLLCTDAEGAIVERWGTVGRKPGELPYVPGKGDEPCPD